MGARDRRGIGSHSASSISYLGAITLRLLVDRSLSVIRIASDVVLLAITGLVHIIAATVLISSGRVIMV